MLRKDNKINTGGKCFSASEIPAAVHQAGGIVIREERIPATTFFFLLIYVVAKTLPQNWAHAFFSAG